MLLSYLIGKKTINYEPNNIQTEGNSKSQYLNPKQETRMFQGI